MLPSEADLEESFTEEELAEREKQVEYTAYLLRRAATWLVPCAVDPALLGME